ncbi:MAG: methylmalonyl Co-A mutase-associated GTPase MeaB [Gammaproteobacteria bacterium]|nr:methylmalonyl Co-A mutase-associated GTPase MeaB [Gammaproteobacteria bacterium]
MSTELAARVRAGERSAVATALNLLDARDPARRAAALPLLNALAGGARAARLGLTGAPGAGKSTLLDALIAALRRRQQSVGIIAVDPSSQVSGGALLADRIRAGRGADDAQVFFRSMASRGRLGGIAQATRAGLAVLAAAYNWVIVETVGVGQSEMEVADLVDTLVYVAQPGAGDVLQYMKAGLLELPDLFAVNKADLGAPAEQTARELQRGLDIVTQGRKDGRPPVLLVSATTDQGIDALVDAVIAQRESLGADGLAARRRAGDTRFVVAELQARYGSYGLAALGGRAALEPWLDDLGKGNELDVVERAGRAIEAALHAPR